MKLADDMINSSAALLIDGIMPMLPSALKDRLTDSPGLSQVALTVVRSFGESTSAMMS